MDSCLILHIPFKHFHVDSTLRSLKLIFAYFLVSWNIYSLFFIYLPLFSSPYLSVSCKEKGFYCFPLQHFFPRVRTNKLQPLTSPGELVCFCTSPLETVRDDKQLQIEHPVWIYSTNIYHLASCVQGGLLSSLSRIIIKINLLTFVWD